VTSYGKDRDGQLFIASIEAINYPIYGVQFHPEELPYNQALNNDEVFSSNSIKISQMLGLKFVDEARKNSNSMTVEELNENRICLAADILLTYKDKTASPLGVQPVSNWRQF
jgi:hypothetical protein